MNIKKKAVFDQIEVDGQTGTQAVALEEAIRRSGGVPKLAQALSVPRTEVYRWKKQGVVPMGKALTIAILCGVSWKDLVSDEDTMWISLMQLERSLGELQAAFEKSLAETTAAIDAMFKLRGKFSENTQPLPENGS